VADGNRTTLVVAVAGIAATALVGIAGTATGWLSARDDRDAQRELARDERTYERRVAVYLDAIDFVEGQRRSIYIFVYRNPLTKIPYKVVPTTRLMSRLRAFGSARVFKEFQETQRVIRKMGLGPQGDFAGRDYLQGSPDIEDDGGYRIDPAFTNGYRAFTLQLIRFQTTIHDEVG
jgi:hypothetical protein